MKAGWLVVKGFVGECARLFWESVVPLQGDCTIATGFTLFRTSIPTDQTDQTGEYCFFWVEVSPATDDCVPANISITTSMIVTAIQQFLLLLCQPQPAMMLNLISR